MLSCVISTQVLAQFSPVSNYVLLLGINIICSTLFSSTLCLCSAINMIHEVSHSCKTTKKIITMNVLIFMHYPEVANVKTKGPGLRDSRPFLNVTFCQFLHTSNFDLLMMLQNLKLPLFLRHRNILQVEILCDK